MKKQSKIITVLLAVLLMLVPMTGCSTESEIINSVTGEEQQTKEVSVNVEDRESVILMVEYDTENYSTGEDTKKKMSVYIPEGYSNDNSYNVAIALHVYGKDEKFWPELGVKEIMDELISSETIEPTLLFMPNDYLDGVIVCENDESIYDQFSLELRNDIIPFIKNTFSVSDNRKDYACIGASLGAYVTVNSALCTNLELISNFGSIGGGVISHWKLDSEWEDCGTKNTDINMLYIGQGAGDNADPIKQGYLNLKAECSKFDDDNLVFSLICGASHDNLEWTTGFSEAMRLFFGSERVDDVGVKATLLTDS